MTMSMANWNSWAAPHACAIVYKSQVLVHRTFGLNVTMRLKLGKHEHEDLFRTDMMKAVQDFGSPWLEQNDMIFHDPLAGACLFEPHLCEYRRGTVDVDFYNKQSLGRMSFQPSVDGN